MRWRTLPLRWKRMYRRSSISCLGDREQEMVKGLWGVVKLLSESWGTSIIVRPTILPGPVFGGQVRDGL